MCCCALLLNSDRFFYALQVIGKFIKHACSEIIGED